MPSDDRDQQFERALARHLRGAEPNAACPDPETLAAYHERTLSLDEMTRSKKHITGCARCQEALALLERSESALAEDWQGEKILPGMTAVRAAEAPPRATRQEEPAQEIAGSALPRAKAIEMRKPPGLNKWTAPIGAIAATLLIGIGWYELRSTRLKTATPVQVVENREVQPQDRAVPFEDRAPSVTAEKKAEAPPAPAKASKKQEGGAIGGTGGGVMSRQEPSLPAKGAANSPARQDSGNYEADQLSANTAAPPVASPALAPRPAETSRATTQTMVAKGATGGPLVSNQANQSQANQNDNFAMKKKEETQKQKDQAASMEVLAMSPGVMTSNAPMSLRDIAIQTPSVIVAPDSKNAWRVGAGGKIEHSGNGGASWKAQTSGVTQDLIAGNAPSKKICWIVGKNGTLLVTTDGGKHWTRILSPITGDLGGVHAQNALHAAIWDVTNREAYETSDGGATWKSTANE
jgi:hypothetical protein